MKLRVECHSGYKANERPIRFYLNDHLLIVEEIMDRWFGEDYEYFRILADDGNTYILKYNRVDDLWGLESYTLESLPSREKKKLVNFGRAQKALRRIKKS